MNKEVLFYTLTILIDNIVRLAGGASWYILATTHRRVCAAWHSGFRCRVARATGFFCGWDLSRLS